MSWLKVETATPDKPEVWAMAAALSLDRDAVFGKLFRVWRWFDEHTEDGNAPGVTQALVDDIAGVTGFAEAMVAVRWLCVSGHGISLPHFDWHNGVTAKRRAHTAIRVQRHKSGARASGNAAGNAQGNASANASGNAQGNAQGNAGANAEGNASANADGNAKGNAPDHGPALPREEKIREELKPQPLRSTSSRGLVLEARVNSRKRPSARATRAASTTRGTRLPDAWQLPDAWLEWAMERCGMSHAQAMATAEVFADHWHAESRAIAVKRDWFATWRNWCRRDCRMGRWAQGPPSARLTPREQRAARDRDVIAALTGRDPMRTPDDVFDLQPEDVRHVPNRQP